MKQLFTSLLIIAAVSFAPASFAGDKVSPVTIDGATTVSAAEAKALFDKGVLFLDVRKDKDWNAGRVPDAIHIDQKKKLNEGSMSAKVKKDQEVVIYCNGPKCMRSSRASKMAVGWGFKKVHYFRDGFPGWKSAGYPVE